MVTSFRTALIASSVLVSLLLPLNLACAQQTGGTAQTNASPAESSSQTPAVKTVSSERGPLEVQQVATGLSHPWGMDFLPDGRLLVTERETGKLYLLPAGGGKPQEVPGTPEVIARGQGGMLDVAVHPDFASNGLVYLSYAAPGENGTSSTALGRGKLADGRLEGFERIFVQTPWHSGSTHFGNRIVFAPDGGLFLTLGERFAFQPAQDLSGHLGKVVRLNDDGTPFKENPFLDQPGAKPEIWSYGHRNIEAATVHPETGKLWLGEMGPKGGDELNLIERGKNYGWPLVSWGNNYDSSPIPDPPTRPDLTDAVHHWTPVISPCGMLFYTGETFPEWKGDLLIGGLTTRQLVRVRLGDNKVVDEERIDLGSRIRDVEQAPDGSVYVLTDERDGSVWRLAHGQP